MEYELYWNKNDDVKPPTIMVIGGSFSNLTDARAYAYGKIALNVKHHLSRSTSTIIEVIGIDRDGVMYDCGKIGTLGSDKDFWVAYIPQGRRKYYRLYRNGSIRK